MVNTNYTPSLLRAQWLDEVGEALRGLFTDKGFTIPANVRFGVGWPKGSHGRAKTLGQCWPAVASADGHFEIFLTPALGTKDTMTIIGTLAHELDHATVGVECGHKGAFKRCALAIGLVGKMTATTEGPLFKAWAEPLVTRIGDFPAGALADAPPGYKKQPTRMIKCTCPDCGYVIRTTRSWIDKGLPICSTHDVPFEEAESEAC